MIGALLASLALAAAPAPAPAPLEPAIDSDLRCVAVFTIILGTNETLTEVERAGVIGGVYYYIGRIEGRQADFDLQTRLIALLEAPGYDKQFPVDAGRCGTELQAKGQLLIDMGKAMQVHSAGAGGPKT